MKGLKQLKNNKDENIFLTPRLSESVDKLKEDITNLSASSKLPDLKLKATIDQNKTINDLNNQILMISSHSSLQKISIGLKIDPTTFKELQAMRSSFEVDASLTANIENQNNLLLEQQRIIDNLKTSSIVLEFSGINQDELLQAIDKVKSAVEDPPSFKEAVLTASIEVPVTNAINSLYSTITKGSEHVFGTIAKSAVTLGTAMRGLLAASGVGLAFTAISFALEGIFALFDRTEQKVESLKKTLEGVSESAIKVQQIQDLAQSYEELAKKTDLSAEEKTKLSKIEDELASKHGINLLHLDSEGKAYQDNINTLKEYIRLKQKEIEEKQKTAEIDLNANGPKYRSNVRDKRKDYLQAEKDEAILTQKYERAKNAYNSKGEDIYYDYTSGKKYSSGYDEGKQRFKTYLNKLAKDRDNAHKETLTKKKDFETELDSLSEGVDAHFQIYLNKLEQSGQKVEPAIRKIFTALASLDAEMGYNFEDNQLKSFFTTLNNISYENFNEVSKEFNNLANDSKYLEVALRVLKNQLTELSNLKINKQGNQLENDLKTMQEKANADKKTIEDLKKNNNKNYSVVSGLNKLLQDESKGNPVDPEEIRKLIEADQSLINIYKMENEQVKLNTIEINKKKGAYINAYTDIIAIATEELKKNNSASIEKISNIQNEKLTLENLGESYKKVNQYYNDKIMQAERSGSSSEATKLKEEKSVLLELITSLQQLGSEAQLSAKALTGIGEAETKFPEKNQEIKETVTLLTELQKKLHEIDDITKRNADGRSRMNKASDEYRKSLEEENRLLGEKRELLLKGIDDPSQLVSRQVTTTREVPAGSNDTNSSSSPNNYSSVINANVGTAKVAWGQLVNKNLKLQTSVTAEELNAFIDKKLTRGGHKNSLLKGKGSTFIEAAKQSGLDPIYLLAHAAEETGWGTSSIAKNKNNFFGIGAFDSSPYKSAYGYNGVDAGIIEGAKWISKFYTNGKHGQNTLGKMRFNGGEHEYATNNEWANNIAKIMSGFGKNALSGNESSVVVVSNKNNSNNSQGKVVSTEVSTPTADELHEAQDMGKDTAEAILDQIYRNNIEIVNHLISKSQTKISKINQDLFLSQNKQSYEKPGSKKWQELNQEQLSLLDKKKIALEEESNTIRNAIEKLNITTGEFDAKLMENSKQWLEIQKERISIIQNGFEAISNEISNKASTSRSKSNRGISLLGDIDTTEDQKKLVAYRQEILKTYDDEIKQLYSEITKYKKIANDSSKSFEERTAAKNHYEHLEDKVNTLNVDKSQNATQVGKEQAKLVYMGFNKEIDNLKFEISLLGDSEEDKKKAKELNDAIALILIQGREAISKTLIEIDRKLAGNLSLTDKSKLEAEKKDLIEQSKSYLSIQNEMFRSEVSAREKQADEIISNYKNMISKKKELELKALQEREKMVDDYHKLNMKRLDDELKLEERLTNDKLKLIDREADQDNYKQDLKKKDIENQKIKDKIAELSLDDSIEAREKRKQLEEELAEKLIETEKFVNQKLLADRKNVLNDTLETKRREIEAAKEAATKQYETTKELFQETRDFINTKYDDMLNDEEAFLQLKQDLLNSDLTIVQGAIGKIRNEYGNLFKFISDNSDVLKIGEKAFGNLSYTLKKDEEKLDSPTINNPPPKQTPTEREKDWATYLNNKKEAEAIKNNKDPRFIKLKDENDRLREKNPDFENKSYDELKNIKKFNTGGYTSDSEGLAWLDKKELVLNDKQTADAFNIFNIAERIIGKVRSFDFGSLFSKKSSSENAATQSLRIEKLIHIDKVEKDVDVDHLLNRINNQFSQWGFSMK